MDRGKEIDELTSRIYSGLEVFIPVSLYPHEQDAFFVSSDCVHFSEIRIAILPALEGVLDIGRPSPTFDQELRTTH